MKSAAARRLHRHDYDEVFIVREGRALSRWRPADRGGRRADRVRAGQYPAQIVNLGPGRLETTDIHATDTIAQENLE